METRFVLSRNQEFSVAKLKSSAISQLTVRYSPTASYYSIQDHGFLTRLQV